MFNVRLYMSLNRNMYINNRINGECNLHSQLSKYGYKCPKQSAVIEKRSLSTELLGQSWNNGIMIVYGFAVQA